MGVSQNCNASSAKVCYMHTKAIYLFTLRTLNRGFANPRPLMRTVLDCVSLFSTLAVHLRPELFKKIVCPLTCQLTFFDSSLLKKGSVM